MKCGTVTRRVTTSVANNAPVRETVYIDIPEGFSPGIASRYADMVAWNIECDVRDAKGERFYKGRTKYDVDAFDRGCYSLVTGRRTKEEREASWTASPEASAA